MKTELQNLLDSNIPNDVVQTRAQGGVTLSYLAAWYVIDRMNQVFGQGNWGYQINSLNKVFEGEIDQYSGKAFSTSYTAVVSLYADVDGKRTSFSEVGYGDGTDKKSPGKAHELAVKESVSDALKRAAKNFGRSMGLALYDKTQEFVGGTDSKVQGADTGSSQIQSQKTVGQVLQSGAVSGNNQIGAQTPGATQPSTSKHGANGSTASPRPIKELVTAKFAKLKAEGKITADEFKTKYQGGDALSKLTQDQLTKIHDQVTIDFNLQ
jgi:DNA recombination protein Rad52